MGHPIARNDPRAIVDIMIKPLKDGSQVLIRGVNRDDLPKLGEIYAKVYTAFDVGETWTAQTATETLTDLYCKNPALALVAEVDGKIVGGNFCDVKKWQGKRVVDAKEIFVTPKMQHLGVGAQLMLEGFYRAKKFYDATEVELITFADRGHARGFYEDLGIEATPGLVLMGGELERIVPNLQSRVPEAV